MGEKCTFVDEMGAFVVKKSFFKDKTIAFGSVLKNCA